MYSDNIFSDIFDKIMVIISLSSCYYYSACVRPGHVNRKS